MGKWGDRRFLSFVSPIGGHLICPQTNYGVVLYNFITIDNIPVFATSSNKDWGPMQLNYISHEIMFLI